MPAVITVSGQRLQAEDDLDIVDLSATSGGDPKFSARMTAG